MRQPFFFGWWQVFIALLVQAVATGSLIYSYSIMVVPLAGEYETTRMTLMLGMTTMVLVGGLISPWLGASIDRFSLKRMMLLGSAALASGFFALSLITSVWQMPLIYGLFMAVASIVLGPLAASTLLARWFHRRRGLAMGIAAMGTSIGGFLFPPLMQWLIDQYEWRMAFRLLAGVILLVLVPLIILLVTDWPRDKHLLPDGDDTVPYSGDAANTEVSYESTGTILRERNFWAIALVMGVLFSTYAMLLSNLTPFALDSGATADQGALLISIIAVMGLIGKLLFGTIADRVDLRLGLGGSALLLTLGLCCFLGSEHFSLLLAGSVAIGLAAGGMLPVWGAMMAQAFGVTHYGRVMGMMAPVLMPFNLVSPPLAGAIFDRTGSYQLTFLVFITLLISAVCAMPLIRLRR